MTASAPLRPTHANLYDSDAFATFKSLRKAGAAAPGSRRFIFGQVPGKLTAKMEHVERDRTKLALVMTASGR
jgi:hypothetical protein